MEKLLVGPKPKMFSGIELQDLQNEGLNTAAVILVQKHSF